MEQISQSDLLNLLNRLDFLLNEREQDKRQAQNTAATA